MLQPASCSISLSLLYLALLASRCDLECQPFAAHSTYGGHNAISGIIIIGALLQLGSPDNLVGILAAISVLIATINIVGGFMVTRRMLAMFQKS